MGWKLFEFSGVFYFNGFLPGNETVKFFFFFFFGGGGGGGGAFL